MVEQYRVCPYRNAAAAYERFFRPSGSQLVFFYLDCGVQRCHAVAGSAFDQLAALTFSVARTIARLVEARPFLVPRAGVEPA